MERIERTIIWISLGFLALLVAAIWYAASARNVDLPGCVTGVKSYTDGQVTKLKEGRYQIFYVAKMWGYDPMEVTVPVGSVVDLYLVSKDVVHGFYLPEKNINLMAIPGVIGYRQITFEKPGIYTLFCHEFCGTGHHAMSARIKVE